MKETSFGDVFKRPQGIIFPSGVLSFLSYMGNKCTILRLILIMENTPQIMLCILYRNCIPYIICLQIHTYIHASKLVDNTFCLLEKQDPASIIIPKIFNI